MGCTKMGAPRNSYQKPEIAPQSWPFPVADVFTRPAKAHGDRNIWGRGHRRGSTVGIAHGQMNAGQTAGDAERGNGGGIRRLEGAAVDI